MFKPVRVFGYSTGVLDSVAIQSKQVSTCQHHNRYVVRHTTKNIIVPPKRAKNQQHGFEEPAMMWETLAPPEKSGFSDLQHFLVWQTSFVYGFQSRPLRVVKGSSTCLSACKLHCIFCTERFEFSLHWVGCLIFELVPNWTEWIAQNARMNEGLLVQESAWQ